MKQANRGHAPAGLYEGAQCFGNTPLLFIINLESSRPCRFIATRHLKNITKSRSTIKDNVFLTLFWDSTLIIILRALYANMRHTIYRDILWRIFGFSYQFSYGYFIRMVGLWNFVWIYLKALPWDGCITVYPGKITWFFTDWVACND